MLLNSDLDQIKDKPYIPLLTLQGGVKGALNAVNREGK